MEFIGCILLTSLLSREIVLGRLAALVKSFVKTVSLARGLSETAAETAGGKIFTFGSYRLGVHGPGTDIDTLCVVPKHVTREDFFEVFEGMLRNTEGVTEVSVSYPSRPASVGIELTLPLVQGVPDAYVPIIKLKISGIPIDFLMARLALSSIPDDLTLQDDNLLRNLDDRCIRSLGGILDVPPNLQILILLIDVCQVPASQIRFCASSRMSTSFVMLYDVSSSGHPVRILATCAQWSSLMYFVAGRAIYSNVNGFLGGVAWAMLVARICQLYPNAVAGAIVSRFFIIMYQWCVPIFSTLGIYFTCFRAWPQPVLLKQIEDGPLQVRVWNPKVRWSSLASQAYFNSSSSCIPAIERIECPSSHRHILLCVPPITLLPQPRWL